jgi:Tol biopolymer transport system component
MKSRILTAEISAASSTRRRLHLLIATLVAVILSTAGPAYATFPGRNGLIAFQAQTDAGIQIFIVRPNGQHLQQITHVLGDALRADWSPDGRRIAFEIDPPGGGCNVALMNPDGGALVVLPHAPNICEGDPSFTPEGSRIVFDRFNAEINDEAFWSMDLNGNDRQRIGPCCFDPNVSPDGEKLSYLTPNGEPTGVALFTSSIDGNNLFQLTPFSYDVAVKQDWAPDGQHLVFSKNAFTLIPGVSANIATIRPDGTHLRFVTHYEGGDRNAFVGSYSPDGRWLVFRLEDHGLFALYKVHPDGSDIRVILPLSTLNPRGIDWGPRPSEREHEDDN